jgi:hypothetical protein
MERVPGRGPFDGSQFEVLAGIPPPGCGGLRNGRNGMHAPALDSANGRLPCTPTRSGKTPDVRSSWRRGHGAGSTPRRWALRPSPRPVQPLPCCHSRWPFPRGGQQVLDPFAADGGRFSALSKSQHQHFDRSRTSLSRPNLSSPGGVGRERREVYLSEGLR